MNFLMAFGAGLALATPAVAKDLPKPSQAQLKEADQSLSLIVSALNSKDVPQDLKNGLFGCLYENPLKKIAAGSSEILAHDAKIDRKDPTQRLLVIARVCGLAPVVSKGASPKAGGG